MGSYYIPSNKLKGEGRILYIFTTKSLIYTAVGGLVGLLIYFLLSMIGLKTLGLIIIAILAIIGYGIGTIKFPSTGNSKLSRSVGGNSVDEVIVNYLKFRKNKRIYAYAVNRKEPDYSTTNSSVELLTNPKASEKKQNNTKEDL